MNMFEPDLHFAIEDFSLPIDTDADKAHQRHAIAVTLELTRLGPKVPSGDDRWIHSIASQRIFHNVILMFARFLEVNRAGNLKCFPNDAPEAFLYARSLRVGEAQLRADRWALQKLCDRKLPSYKAARPQDLKPRAFTAEQISAIAAHQTCWYAFSTWLAAATGMRGMELLTIGPPELQPRDPRPIPAHLHAFMPPGVLYTTAGKGGLVRWVLVPLPFVEPLESRRRPTPVVVRHERSYLTSYFDIPGGKAWGSSFRMACYRTFGKSAGGHGLRHTFTAERMDVFTGQGISERDAKFAISVELGHFRPDVVDLYLRGFWSPDL